MRRIRRLLAALLAIAATIVAPTVPTAPVRAQSDDAARIRRLAQILYDDNLVNDNYTFWVGGAIRADATIRPTHLNVGKPMPDFRFNMLNGDGRITRADLKPPYMVNTWASWCGPCIKEFPLLNKAIADGILPMPVLFVNAWDEKEAAQQFLAAFDPDLKAFVDTDDVFMQQAGIRAIPVTILVDASGNIQAMHVGNMTDASIVFFAEIAARPGIGSFDSGTDAPAAIVGD